MRRTSWRRSIARADMAVGYAVLREAGYRRRRGICMALFTREVRNWASVRNRAAADPHVLEDGHAPTPFLLEEIRMGSPVGRTIRVLVEVDGVEPYVRVQRYVWTNERSATTERWRET